MSFLNQSLLFYILTEIISISIQPVRLYCLSSSLFVRICISSFLCTCNKIGRDEDDRKLKIMAVKSVVMRMRLMKVVVDGDQNNY